MPRRWSFWLVAAMLAANAGAPRRVWAQTISVPLGTARQFGLLSGGALSTDPATPVRVDGRAGAATTIDGPIQANGGLYRPGSGAAAVSTALNDLATARAYCSSLSSTALTSLNGQTLTGGAYTLTGTTTLSAGTPLTLDAGADSTAVFVITVTGSFTLDTGAVVRRGRFPAPGNVYWNVGGALTAYGASGLPGYVLAGGPISAQQRWPVPSALLGAGAISLVQLGAAAADGGPTFYGPLPPPLVEECASNAVLSTDPCPNLVYNGTFTEVFPGLNPASVPSQLANICNGTSNPSFPVTNELAAWSSANQATPDWFRAGAPGSGSGIPVNGHGGGVPALSHGTTGGPYAGVYAYRSDQNGRDSPTPDLQNREYVRQGLATPLRTGKHYYAEFWSQPAGESRTAVTGSPIRVARLGMAIRARRLQQTDQGVVRGVVPQITANNRLTTLPTFNRLSIWSRTAGGFQAAGGENQVTLGHFDANQAAGIIPSRQGQEQAYYYLDDVLIQAFPENVTVALNGCYELGVDCPLPLTSNARYEWLVWAATPAPGYWQPVYVGYPFSAAQPNQQYIVRITVPLPDGSTYPQAAPGYVQLGPITTGCGLDICNGVTIQPPPGRSGVEWGPNNPWDPAHPEYTTPRTVRGQITVPAGVTLTVQGVTVQFADTRSYQAGNTPRQQPVNPTLVVVNRGGRLRAITGAVLTVLRNHPCQPPGHKWDGVQVDGSMNNPQTTPDGSVDPNQGWAQIYPGSTIEDAYFGVIAGGIAYEYVASAGAISLNGSGGGVVEAYNATFRNCNFGVYLMPWPNAGAVLPTRIQRSRVQLCHLYRDTPWGIFNYAQSGYTTGVPFQTIQVALRGVTQPLLTGNLIENIGVLGAAPISNGVVVNSASARIGLNTYTPNRFRNLDNGIKVDGSADVSLTIQGNVFEGNKRGIYMEAALVPQITDNTFRIPADGTGIVANYCAGFQIEGNLLTGPLDPGGAFTMGNTGIRIFCSDYLPYALGNQVYRNYLSHLQEGIRSQHSYTSSGYVGNNSLQVLCNNFATETKQRVGLSPGTMVKDIVFWAPQDQLPAAAHQGQCDPLGRNYTLPANNVFSQTQRLTGNMGYADIYLFGSSGRFITYHYLDDGLAGNPSQGTTVPSFNGNPRLQLDPCTGPAGTFDERCRPFVHRAQSDADLKAELAAAPAPEEQEKLMAELLRRYLNDTTLTVEAGLDSSISVMEHEDPVKYAEPVAALYDKRLQMVQVGNRSATTASARVGGRPGRRAGPEVAPAVALEADPEAALKTASPAGALGAPDAGRGVRTSAYRWVRELLAPLGTDSAITGALRADSSLQAPLWELANDTLSIGYEAGRTALTYYLGYQFRPVAQPELALPDSLAGNRAAPAAPQVKLYPNPSTGHVAVTFSQPTLTKGTREAVGQLLLYNAFGQAVRTLALPGAAGTAALELAGLRPGLYYYTHWVDGRKAQTGTLMLQP